MASRAQMSMAAAAARRNAARATPPIQTDHPIERNTRFSYMETPVENERSNFEPNHQFPSPTNSTIDESPITPASPARGLPAYPNEPHETAHTLLPLEKAQAQSPHEMHPAYSAPFNSDLQPNQPQPQISPPTDTYEPHEPHSPGPIPTKKQEISNNSVPVATTQIFDPPPTSTIERRGTYNPDSLAGPNGVPLENHRPGQVSHPNANMDPHWKHGLCEPDILCCMGLVCPCMVYGKTIYRLSRKAQRQDPTDVLGYQSCNGSCGLFAAACGFQCNAMSLPIVRIIGLLENRDTCGDSKD